MYTQRILMNNVFFVFLGSELSVLFCCHIMLYITE